MWSQHCAAILFLGMRRCEEVCQDKISLRARIQLGFSEATRTDTIELLEFNEL